MTRRVELLLLFLVVALAGNALVRVSLLTALPGPEIYELEGHTGLRFQDPQMGGDVVVNWGIYDFAAPNFVYRFVKGETDYLCALSYTESFLQQYRRQGRAVIEQPLELDSVETERLMALISANLEPENRVYRYNYVRDNCATRPLELIEQAIGRRLISDEPAQTTWRREMKRYHTLYPWYQFGIDLALGRGIDRPISERETAFAPVTLMLKLEADTITGPRIDIGTQTHRPEPTPWYLTPMAVAVLLLLCAVAMIFCPVAWLRQTFDTLLFGMFGLLGCVIAFLVFISSHEATSPNLLLLWLNPLCLLGAVLPWIKNAKKLKNCYFFANFALLIVLTITAPALGRAMNAAFWPLIAADAVRSLANAPIVWQKAKCT